MQQDTSNNNPADNWKQRLETDADCMAAFTDNDKAWDKLYKKLHKPRRKNAVWYWIAAAGTAVILFCSLLMQPLLQQETDTAIQPSAPAKQKTGDINKKQEMVIAAAPDKKEVDPATSSKNKVTEKNTPATMDTKLVAATEKMTTDSKQDTAALPIAIQEGKAEPLATVQPKPALKVVHVNELGGAEQNSLHKPGTDYSAIRFGVNNKTTPPTGKIGIHISTAKSSPSN